MRVSSVTLCLGVLVLVLLCSSVGSTPAINLAKSRRYIDEVYGRGHEATARALGKRQAWRNEEKAAERMARKKDQKKSHDTFAENWRKRDNDEFHDDIIGFFLALD